MSIDFSFLLFSRRVWTDNECPGNVVSPSCSWPRIEEEKLFIWRRGFVRV